MCNIAEVYLEGSLVLSNRNWVRLTLGKGILLKGHQRHTKLMEAAPETWKWAKEASLLWKFRGSNNNSGVIMNTKIKS